VAIVAARRAVALGPVALGPIALGPVALGRPVTVVAARAAIGTLVIATRRPVTVLAARTAVLSRGRGRERLRLSGLALGGGATEGAARRGDDPGGLGAHAQDAAAALGEDLEVEVAEADPEQVAGRLDGLLDGLAGELLVLAHVSVVSLVGPDGPS
jgi:hypothetical protein